MKDLSLTQKYLICTVNEKGALPGYNQKMVACLIGNADGKMYFDK